VWCWEFTETNPTLAGDRQTRPPACASPGMLMPQLQPSILLPALQPEVSHQSPVPCALMLLLSRRGAHPSCRPAPAPA